MKGRKKPYRVIGAYDTETTNIIEQTDIYAFPVCYQLGIIDCKITELNSLNVREHCDVRIYRHAVDLYERLDAIQARDYVPVLLCHNLAFDMYSLAPYLKDREVRVLAKSARKPITFTVLDDNGKPRLVFWDTLVFSQQSLERMGNDCGYEKATGKWDYALVRTPETALTEDETIYAKDDIYALLSWLSWWLLRNPDISPEKIGLNVVTKTGIVRELRKVRYANIRCKKYTLGKQWYLMNQRQAPKSDDELFTMQAATRGGFTFCASESASVAYDLEDTPYTVAAYDATSMHPAQMVSHRYPVSFHETSCEALDLLLDKINSMSVYDILKRWSKPFVKAVYACYKFVNLRPKENGIFKKYGVYPLASARFKDASKIELEYDEENGDAQTQDNERRYRGYCDTCENPRFEFGKLVSADTCTVYVTELALFEICQAYEWDESQALHGYMSGRFSRATDFSIVSVMQFYKAKNLFKVARANYYKNGCIGNAAELISAGVSPSIVNDMVLGQASENDVESCYLGLKANLNSLFGIEATNEYRRDTVLTENGIEYTGDIGICNAPKNNKAWYQFGQRIVGWSRIAQICAMELTAPYVETVICGDTDSLKMVIKRDNLAEVDKALSELGNAIDRGKIDNCSRVFKFIPDLHDDLKGIGHYELEYTVDRFCSAWNKAYCKHDGNGYHFTLAGVPTGDVYKKDDNGELALYETRVNGFADKLGEDGWSFEQVCNLLLGYNVTFAHDLTGLNARKFPRWGDTVYKHVTDYRGKSSLVCEPSVLALYPMAKTIGAYAHGDNRVNAKIAIANNAGVNTENVVVSKKGVLRL